MPHHHGESKSTELDDAAYQAAYRIIANMRQSDRAKADDLIELYRSRPAYDVERARKHLAEAIWLLCEEMVILTIEDVEALGGIILGAATPYYLVPPTIGKKWDLCHRLNWRQEDFDQLVREIGSLAADDCTVLDAE